MVNNKKIILAFILITAIWALRQSEMGSNDWSRENIGRLVNINFQLHNAQLQQNKNTRVPKNLFYYSELGIFGQLNRRSGQIISRQSLGEQERVIQEDEKQFIILTPNNQVVRYNKVSMHRTVDNRLFAKQYRNIHSYARANNKIFLANDKLIKQLDSSIKRTQQLSTITAPSEAVFLKVFVKNADILMALTYTQNTKQVCLNEIINSQLNSKSCLKLTNSIDNDKFYVRVYESTGNLYFGDNQQHYHFNLNTHKSREFNKKPVSFSSTGVRLQNGLTYVGEISSDKIIQVNSNRVDKIFIAQLVSNDYLAIYQASEKQKGNKFAKISLINKQSKPSKVWLNIISSTQTQIIVQYQDLQLVMYTQLNGEYHQTWSREQSLAYIDKVLFMKYEGYADHLNNPYHIKMDDPIYNKLSIGQKLSHFPANFILRLKCEMEDIYNFGIQKIQSALDIFKNPSKLQNTLNFKNYIRSPMGEQSQKKYGLRKYIIIITQHNTMFAIDTKTSEIIWKKKYGTQMKLVTLIKLKQQYEKQVAIAINYKYHITYITQIHQDGSMTELAQYQTFCEPTVHKISPHSVLLRADDKVHRYDINKQLLGTQKQYSFFSLEQKQGKVIGWKINGQELTKTWQFGFPSTQKIIKSSLVYRGQPQANLPLVNDKKVLFKNVDFSNLAILTLEQYIQQTAQGQKPGHRLHLYIINGLTGTIQFSQYQTGVNYKLPINIVYDEHNVMVTYYNTRNRVYEIWSVQGFQIPQQSQLLSKKYEPLFQKQDIIFRSKVYGTVLPIKNIFISQSKQALLKRNLIIITRQNKIYLLPRQFVSTRRPKTADAQANANSGQAQFIISKYPPEQYVLPLNTLGYMNHNKKLKQLTQIRFSSSDLESTIFMMAYGIDIFLVRIAPDKAFDMLSDGFNYMQLILIMTAVTIAAVFFKGKVKQTKLKKPHLQ